jgi:photosystem II stability/assembly factor-like uncharacterized protein
MNACPSIGLAAMLAALCAWPAVGAGTDVLERPAASGVHMSSRVLLAVTRVGQRLVAVGERGIVLFSDDSGISWKQAQVPVSVSLTDVHFVNGRMGWAVGHSGVVLHSADAGVTWIKQFDGRQAAALILRDAEKAAPQSGDKQARLRDAKRIADEGPDKPFFAVRFLDEQHGFIVGAYGLFFATGDGGRSWEPCHTRIDNAEGRHLYGISAHGASVYIAGEQGALYRSDDGGRNFVTIKTPYSGSYFGVARLAEGEVVIYGLKGHAYWSDDGKHNWRKLDTGTQAAFTAALALTDGSIVMVTQAGEMLRGTSGGRALQSLPVAQRFPFSGIAQTADANLVLSGVRGMVRIPLAQPKK